nr:MMPL family transporter [Methyloligella halotolerans]
MPRRSLTFGIERLGLLSLSLPRLLLIAVVVLITIGAFFGMQRLRVDDSLSELFRTDTPEFATYESLSERFPSSEYDVLIVVTGQDLLARDSIIALRNLAVDLHFVDGMAGQVSLFSAREAPQPGKVPGPVFPDDLPEGAAYDQMIQKVRDNEIIKGKLLSDDGTLALILLALDRDIVAEQGLETVIKQIKDTAKQDLGDTDLQVSMSGAPVMQLEIRNAVKRDRNLYNALGFLFGAVIAFAFFRRFSLMIVAALPPVIAIVWSLGMFGWLGFKLNLFLNVMIPLIMVLGFSDSMQLTVAARDRMLRGRSPIDASRYSLLVVGPACVLSSTTAAVSFLALFFSDSALIRTFGIAGALSTILAFIVCIMIVPLLVRLLIRDHENLGVSQDRDNPFMEALKNRCAWLADFVVKRPLAILSLGVIAVLALGIIYSTLPPRYRLADQVPDKEQAVEASAQLDQKLTGANPLHVMIDWPAGKSLYDPDVLAVIGEVHDAVQSEPDVGNVWSIATLQRWLARTDEDTPEKLQEYVSILPDYLTNRFINEQAHAAVVTGRVPDIDVSNLLPVVDKLETRLNQLREQHPEFQIRVTGLSAIAARNSASMIENLNMGLTVEIAVIALFLGLIFRSWLVVVVSVVPILFPVFSAGALLALSGEGLQFASIVALIVAFGLSLNATVHYLNRLRLEDREHQDPTVAVRRAAVLIGPALVLTSTILAFGLGITVLSSLPSLRLFGKLAALTLIAALIGDLVLLPAFVLVIRRVMARLRGEPPATNAEQASAETS